MCGQPQAEDEADRGMIPPGTQCVSLKIGRRGSCPCRGGKGVPFLHPTCWWGGKVWRWGCSLQPPDRHSLWVAELRDRAQQFPALDPGLGEAHCLFPLLLPRGWWGEGPDPWALHSATSLGAEGDCSNIAIAPHERRSVLQARPGMLSSSPASLGPLAPAFICLHVARDRS